ncbi:hypothetical protein SAMN05421741_11851 [Paenimyroides ummariense]|uniref:Uncharacterized protein n=1 Tax=Paenimyroides ummariense TaxID=913024 RepID=A0A1I5E1T3_9FLAO|nr:hypothetical protein [Paenimyroides ummariense]SFO05442.1 hypothetical protein SAMN05421741_11851 [Paenimyroides ummariense]
MNVLTFTETFAPGVMFSFGMNVFEVEKSKVLHGTQFVIITKQKVFNMLGIDADAFLKTIKFLDPEEINRKQLLKMHNEIEKTKNIITQMEDNKSISIAMADKKIYLPKVSNTATDVLQNMLDQFNTDKVTPELIEKTKAVTAITKEMINIGRLELDYIKLQTDKS